jgi:inosine-uridine nucleoside N-ribohydrolase
MLEAEPLHIPEQFQQKYNVLIDTDIGDDIDDALALALALRSPEIELRGVTTVFGDTLKRAHLASHLLHVFGREDIPIAAGRQEPLQPRHRSSGVPQAAILNKNEKFSIVNDCSGPELIVQTAMSYPGRLTILCLGPLTNVALALSIEPRLFMTIGSIIMMGGSSSMPLPDWNVRSDARAAQMVLAAGVPVTLIGLNITKRCRLRMQDIDTLHNAHSPQVHLLSQLLAIWQRHHPRWHGKLPYLHDPLTVVALCSPKLFRFEEMTIRILTHGPFKGFTVPRVMDGPLGQAAVDVRAAEAREWVMGRLL